MLEGQFFPEWDGAVHSFTAELWDKGVTTRDHTEMKSSHSFVWLYSGPDGISGQ